MAAGTRVATPRPANAKPAIVVAMFGKASAVPIPVAAITPPVRATVASPNRSTNRSPIIRPTNMLPTSAM